MQSKPLPILTKCIQLRVILFLLFTSVDINSQSLEIFNINIKEYPVIKANFKANDSLNVPFFNLTKEQVHIYENNEEREIIYLRTPAKNPKPLSVILAFDVSGSMNGERLKIAKEAANTFINEISGTRYELAITTFNNTSFINCDFTNNEKILKKVVSELNSFGGTCYDSAFMQPYTGIFEIMQKAKYKKVVIFMTDGLSKANTDTITLIAKNDSISIFCTSIELPMPDILKDISHYTDGGYYSEVNDPDRSKEIYKDIYNEIVTSDRGTIKWLASKTCGRDRLVKLTVKDLKTESGYSLANRIEKNFEIKPQSFFIGPGKTGSEVSRSILLRAIERPVVINNITTDLPEILKIDKMDSSLTLIPGNNTIIRFNCLMDNPVKSHAKIFIEAEDCIENSHIDIFFGQKGTIEVTNPKAGDIFAVGTDVNIQWKGVPKDQKVSLFYRNNNTAWRRIDNGLNLNYNWVAPKDTGSKYQIKIQTLDGFEKGETIQLSDKSGFTDFYDISSDGNLIAYKNRSGYIKLVHIESGEVIKSYKNQGARYIFIGHDNKKICSFFKNSMSTQNIYTNEPEIYISSGEQGFLLSSINSNFGDEYLIPAKVDPFTYPGEKTKFVDYSTDQTYFIKTGKLKVKYAAISDKGKTIIVLTDDNTLMYTNDKNNLRKICQLEPGYQKIITGPDGKYCYIKYPLKSQVLKTRNGKTILNTSNDIYLRFSPDGYKLMTLDSSLHTNIWDLENEKIILQIPVSKYRNFSLSGNYMHYYYNSTVYIYDFEKEKYIIEKYLPGVSQIKMNPDDQEFLIVKNAMCKVYDLSSGDLNSDIITQSFGGVLDAYFDVNSNVLVRSESLISRWEPRLSYEPGISKQFIITSPQPDILPNYDLGKQEVLKRREIIIPEIIKNKSGFPIKIESVNIEEENSIFEMVSGNYSYNILPGKSKDIEIGFTPDKIGSVSSNIIIVTPDTSYQCHITGEGIKPVADIPDKLIYFGKITVNTRKDTLVTLVKNISSETLLIEKVINNSPDKDQFGVNIDKTNILLKPGESLDAGLFYNAIYKGLSSGIILLKIQGMIQPVTVKLLGEGINPKNIRIYGHTLKAKDSTSVEAMVLCTNLYNNQLIFDIKTDRSGFFEFVTQQGNNYLMYAEKEGYISNSENINLNKYPFPDSIEKNIYLSELQKGSVFRLNGVFFVFAKAELLGSSASDLERVLQILKTHPEINLEIHGHTDYIGSEESNMELSKKRAGTIQNYLIKNGIAPERLNIKYFGESNPIADNETEEGRQLNRRVEFVIVE